MSLGKIISNNGWSYASGSTWHVAEWRGTNDVVPCFEVAWDDEGVPTLTGGREPKTLGACQATEAEIAWIENRALGTRREKDADGFWQEVAS